MNGHPLEFLAKGFDWNQQVLSGLVDGFSAEDHSKRFNEAKCSQWLLGHHAACRRMLGRILGLEVAVASWEDYFGMESSGDVTSDWPGPDVLIVDSSEVGEKVSEAISRLTPEMCEQKSKSIHSDEESTMSGRMLFMYWHECFHLGQLAMIRSMLGLPYLA